VRPGLADARKLVGQGADAGANAPTDAHGMQRPLSGSDIGALQH
jgi:hypothetical protein